MQRELGQYGDKMYSLLKYDGNPFEPAEIIDGFDTRISGSTDTQSEYNTRMEPATGD